MSSENKESVDCVRLPCPFPPEIELKPGHFCWGPTFQDGTRPFYFVMPGEVRPSAIHVKQGAAPGGIENNYVWGWDGNEDKPTFEPSIWFKGHWHGFMRAGRLQSC